MSNRRSADLTPASGIPLLYFGFAHACLALAFAVLVVLPGLPAGFFHHPRMIAVIHLVTLGWISSSILGAFYIVGPLALQVPLRPGSRDRVMSGSYALGVAGMVAHFWIGEYHGMIWSAGLVAAAVAHVAIRAWTGLRRAAIPWAIKLHVVLAFVNMLAAIAFGMLVGLNRLFGWFAWSPTSAAFAHAHLAAVGWAVMMVVGLSYRLIPMILPAGMPSGSSMAWSAVLLEAGVIGLAVAMLAGSPLTPVPALVIAAGLATFVRQLRRILGQRRSPPAALPRPDWTTWQTGTAFAWLLIAMAAGLALTLPLPLTWTIALGWIYGTAGLVGFLAQIVVGIQGRLLPLHGWYRMFQRGGRKPPAQSAHTLANPALARASLFAWMFGVPLLTSGLAANVAALISLGSAFLLAGVAMNAAQGITIATTDSNLPALEEPAVEPIPEQIEDDRR